MGERLRDKVAIITGASRGIGAAIATQMAEEGAKVVLVSRKIEGLQAVADEIRGNGGDATPIACHAGDPEQRQDMLDQALKAYGKVDILVNNAGTTEVVPAENESDEQFLHVLNVNLNGSFYCAQRFGRAMLEAGSGSIINVASIFGFVGSGSIPQAGYVASKGAVVNMTRELAAQWARRGVRVNGIAPGFFKSEMTEEMFSDERSMTWLRKKTPAGRPGEVEELYGAVIYLASDASSYVTGQTIAVDGGWTAI